MNPDWRKVKISEAESALTWIQISQEEDDVSCSCYFTDLINIYSEHLNKTGIETRFQDRNPGMETDDYQDFLTNVRTDGQSLGRRPLDFHICGFGPQTNTEDVFFHTNKINSSRACICRIRLTMIQHRTTIPAMC